MIAFTPIDYYQNKMSRNIVFLLNISYLSLSYLLLLPYIPKKILRPVVLPLPWWFSQINLKQRSPATGVDTTNRGT